MANIISKFSLGSQPAAEKQPAVEPDNESVISLDCLMDEIRKRDIVLTELLSVMKRQNDLLDDIAKAIVGLSAGNSVHESQNDESTAEQTETGNAEMVEHKQQLSLESETFVSAIQKTAGILLLEKDSSDSAAQFVLNKITGSLSFNPASYAFCVYDVAARLVPFAEVTIQIQDGKVNEIKELSPGQAELRDGSWYCTDKPKLQIN